jgi:hypothetical protein
MAPSSEPDIREAGVDEQLAALFQPASVALRERRRVIALGLWQPTRVVSLLPFHAYLGRAPFSDLLPVHPKFGVLSFRSEDDRLLDSPLYDTTAALEFRRRDRIRRAGLRSGDSLTPADWEQGLNRRPGRFKNLPLPGSSFVKVVHPTTGRSRRRPVLGRIARSGPESVCFFHNRGELTTDATRTLASVDFLIIDIQGLRAPGRISSVSQLLTHRGSARPTLVVAAGPSDLVPLWEVHKFEATEFETIGQPVTSPEAQVRLVGRDRLQAEREFDFAFGGLSADDAVDRKLLSLAKSAWWAARQQLSADGAAHELRRFEQAVDTLSTIDPTKANSLGLGKQLLQREANNAATGSERRQAIVDVSLSARGGIGLLVLTRNWQAADALRADLASEGWNQTDLQALGVVIRPPSWSFRGRTDTAVAAGFFGPQTTDCALSSQARHLYFVLDPVEVRALWFSLGTILQILERAKAEPAQRVIRCVREAIERHVPAFASDLSVAMDFHETAVRSQVVNPTSDPVEVGYVAILLADGTRLDVPANARFEIVNRAALKLRRARASDLRAGDEILVLNDDSRAEFSDRLLTVVDSGPLASAAMARQTWFEILKAVRAENPLSIRKIAEAMTRHGNSVGEYNVRSWLPTVDEPSPLIPDSLDKFLAFANALQIALPHEALVHLYTEIRRWRDGHRKCGRYLVRAIRGAYSARLDAPTLSRIERDWGMNARQLMQAVELATVDSILQATEGTIHGSH